jgi:hypothetical protein
MSGSSASSIVELSRRKSRYHDQDALLRGFVGHAGCTAKEVAAEVLDWKYDKYGDAPKRAHDLYALGYLEQLPGRVCRRTGKSAHTYRVTEKGVAHLHSLGNVLPAVSPESAAVETPVVRPDFSKLRELLR